MSNQLKFNEDSRVKIPALLTLSKLGFEYLSLKDFTKSLFTPDKPKSPPPQISQDKSHDNTSAQSQNPTQPQNFIKDSFANATLNLANPQSYIFAPLFHQAISTLNPHATPSEIQALLRDILLMLDYDDLGRAFYHRLTSQRGIKLIDFENFERNSFHALTELTYKEGDEEFRPDITVLINGLPLCFIEVKIPHNKEGVLAEQERMQKRFANKKFKKFFNALQILVFSNNQQYDDESTAPISGAFYATTATQSLFLNRFREPNIDSANLSALDKATNEALDKSLDESTQNFILQDNNSIAIKNSSEFITNTSPTTPTNRLLISLFSKPRLAHFLRYSIAYVEKRDKQGTIHIQKHIMRYQQFFAQLALAKSLDNGVKKGIIWHTQGSGKTAFAFYNVKFLQDYFSAKGILTKFYFIVDRLDLKDQASKEFSARGLCVRSVESKDELSRELQSKSAISNTKGASEITVINIQQLPPDSPIVPNDYGVQIQRIYFIDEAHRSYKENGSYLANLLSLDKEAIFISLTGTPLLGGKSKKSSKAIWGDYIHQYYYNSSIADGYTLRLIREDIQTRYKEELRVALENIQINDKDLAKEQIYAHKKFVTPMLAYIADDLKDSRIASNDSTIGAMIVCSSANQAKMFFEVFKQYYKDKNPNDINALNSAALILHDIDDKATRTSNIEDFKNGKIDILFVYNMLLTGFDAPRLKKLYIDRKIKEHNLLQTLARVNRPYHNFRYGYVVDFADIQKEFDKANQAYFDELQKELGDDFEKFSQIFKSEAQIKADLESIKLALFDYDTSDREIFDRQISAINDKKILYEIKKALILAKELQNAIRIQGDLELQAKFNSTDFALYNELLKITQRKIDEINFKEALQSKSDISGLLNLAMEDILFRFIKVGESELHIADSLKRSISRTREALQNNFDKKDPHFISLKEALMEIFSKMNLGEITNDIEANKAIFDNLFAQITELNRQNDLIAHKYNGDYKFARIHKRLKEKIQTQADSKKIEMQICEALQTIKGELDKTIADNDAILDNESYFEQKIKSLVSTHFEPLAQSTALKNLDTAHIATLIAKEYLSEHKMEAA